MKGCAVARPSAESRALHFPASMAPKVKWCGRNYVLNFNFNFWDTFKCDRVRRYCVYQNSIYDVGEESESGEWRSGNLSFPFDCRD